MRRYCENTTSHETNGSPGIVHKWYGLSASDEIFSQPWSPGRPGSTYEHKWEGLSTSDEISSHACSPRRVSGVLQVLLRGLSTSDGISSQPCSPRRVRSTCEHKWYGLSASDEIFSHAWSPGRPSGALHVLLRLAFSSSMIGRIIGISVHYRGAICRQLTYL